MLVPIHTSGTRLPLFFIHGVVGIMPLASTLARALGPDQPFYIFHANGVDGRQPIIDNMPDLVRA
jgi:thioesterase domain-containing protein